MKNFFTVLILIAVFVAVCLASQWGEPVKLSDTSAGYTAYENTIILNGATKDTLFYVINGMDGYFTIGITADTAAGAVTHAHGDSLYIISGITEILSSAEWNRAAQFPSLIKINANRDTLMFIGGVMESKSVGMDYTPEALYTTDIPGVNIIAKSDVWALIVSQNAADTVSVKVEVRMWRLKP